MKKNLYIILWIFSLLSTAPIKAASSVKVAGSEAITDWAKQTWSFLETILALFSQEILLNLLFATFTIFFTFFISKIIREKLFNFLEKKVSENESWTEMVWVVTRTVNITVLVSGFSIALWILWVDLTIFVWWIWFGVGFTLKTFLTNFIAWIIMITQNTYHNWDLVGIDWEMWTITKINTLFTSVEKFDWVLFYVPNIKFIDEKVSNYNSNDKRRVEVEVLIDYKSDIHKAKTIITKVLESFPNILKAPKYDVLVDKLDNSWILLKIRFWITSQDQYFQVKSNITETINLAFFQYWIKIPYPHVHIENFGKEEIVDNIHIEKII